MARAAVRFNPYKHFPATDEDRRKIEYALWEGWELTVDEITGEVWIGSKEELIARIVLLGQKDICVIYDDGTQEILGDTNWIRHEENHFILQ